MSKSKFNVPAIVRIFADCIATGIRKNHDYGAARDCILDNGLFGVAVRMDDKMARILSLVKPGHEPAVKDESLRDTARDMINYAAYLVMLLDKTWGVESPIAWSVTDWEAMFSRVAREVGVPPALIRFRGYEMDVDQLGELFKANGRPLPTEDSKTIHVFPIGGIGMASDDTRAEPPAWLRAPDKIPPGLKPPATKTAADFKPKARTAKRKPNAKDLISRVVKVTVTRSRDKRRKG